MQQVYIPNERIRKLKLHKELISRVEKLCNCKITLDSSDDIVEINGEAYPEYSARSIIYAFGRGFEMEIASKLSENDYYFSSIDISQLVSSDKRMKQVKARIIGEDGRTKRYIEEVSGAKMSVYGDTVSFIGTIEQINEAETAANTLIEGGTHRLAYHRMEAAHRKNKAAAKKAAF
jgi:ribosomal RNA assembly protein